MSGDKLKIIFLILILTILFAFNSVATGYVAGTASHATLYADAIRGRGGATVNVNDNMVVTGIVSVSNVVVSTSNGNIGRLANGGIWAMGSGTITGVSGLSAAGEGVRGTHINSGNYGVLGTATHGVRGESNNVGVRGHNSVSRTAGILANANYGVQGFSGGANYNEGYIGGPTEGVRGTNFNGNLGYLGGVSYGVRGEYNNAGISNYAFLGSALEGVYARGATYGGRIVNTNGNYLYGGGTNYGGYGSAGDYIGILGDNTHGFDSAGVYGTSSNGHNGILGDNFVGVKGTNSNGNYGTLGSANYGVYGSNGNVYGYLGGASYGVRGSSTISYGVYGSSSNAGSPGVYGTGASAGVKGVSGTTSGILGDSVNNRGVTGDCSPAGCYGLWTDDSLYAGNGITVDGDAMCQDADGWIACNINDIAEDIYSKENLENGDVVIIDTENVEHVKKSNKPYDMLAAGIISSNPAFHIKTSDTGIPLALAGRVKAKASAENGPIKIGDLLTTSSTPGHLMRCENKEKCIGAIVGKALEPLASGKNKITVLVMLA